MSKPYTPQPGTIPARVIKHLQTLPPGTFVSTAALSELLDIQLYSVASSLAHPRSMGVVVSRHTESNRRALEWALGDGKPLPLPDDYEPEEPLHTHRNHVPQRTPLALPMLGHSHPTDSESSDHFRAGVFTDGSLLIEIRSVVITLNPTQAAQVARLTTQGIQP
jgi:hypothetical protein